MRPAHLYCLAAAKPPAVRTARIPLHCFFHTSSLLRLSTASSSTTRTMDPRINSVIDFWFNLSPQAWFQSSTPELDAELRDKFGDLVREARASSLDEIWTASPHGTLALVLLLDQVPRNIFRGSGESFSSDPKAVEIATRGIARGFDTQLSAPGAATSALPGSPIHHRMFFYMPFCHTESLLGQVAGVALVEGLAHDVPADAPERALLQAGVDFFRRHRDCVARWGRFPKRNEWLGRESTPEERKWLEENPMGF
ncbi:hypothetical protein BX600DRAFT_518261 [Xylariales sp. PMI_506]|nr:hypothetical protein BX600DRAFT_518261 [Xylariales sp. PMI_506]